jgi:hypothetical protein
MRWPAVLFVSAVTACAGEPIPAGGDAPLGDALPSATGLTLRFITNNELPATLDGDVRVEDVYLNGAVIRAVGDATTQDERATTRYDYELHWDQDDQPRGLSFAAAPTGEYSYVELRFAGRPGTSTPEAFEIEGSARVDGDREDFVIRGNVPVVIATVPASLRLEAGRSLAIDLELDVGRLVAGIDFESLPSVGGTLRLDEQSPAQLAAFTTALAGAFSVRQP